MLKSIYGLRTAQRQWQATFLAAMAKHDLQAAAYTDCILAGYLDGQPVILITYVDDIVVLGPPAARQKALDLIRKYFKASDPKLLEEASADDPMVLLGEAMYLEGQDSARKLIVSQEDYVNSIVAAHGNEIVPRDGLNEKHFTLEYLMLDDAEVNPPLTPKEATEFRSVLGSEAFAAIHTRRDAAVATATLAEGQAAPGKRHLEVAYEVLGFLAGTASRRLELAVPLFEGEIHLGGDADANFLAERARQGVAVVVGDSKVETVTHTRTQRQATYSTSTAEAELKCLSWAAKVILGIANVVREVMSRVGVPVRERIDLRGDNAAANLLARRDGDLRKVRHISLADLFIREATSDGRIRVNYVPSDANIADPLTKVMSRSRLEPNLRLLGLMDPPGARAKRSGAMTAVVAPIRTCAARVRERAPSDSSSDTDPEAHQANQAGVVALPVPFAPESPECVAAAAAPTATGETGNVMVSAVAAATGTTAHAASEAVEDSDDDAVVDRDRRHMLSRSRSPRGPQRSDASGKPVLRVNDAAWAARPTSSKPCGLRCYYARNCYGRCGKRSGHDRRAKTERAAWHLCPGCCSWLEEGSRENQRKNERSPTPPWRKGNRGVVVVDYF